MIEIKLVISICTAVFFFGMLIGLAIMGAFSSRGYDDAVEYGYKIGYEKGKTESERTEKIAV